MADCAAISLCTRAPLVGSRPKTKLGAMSINFWSSGRECMFFGKAYLSHQPPSLKFQVVGAPFCTAVRGKKRMKKNSLGCRCLGALLDPENMSPASLLSYVDEALLVVSVIFAYMAGAIPHYRAANDAKSNRNDQNPVASSSVPYGRSLENDTESKARDSWSEVEGKLLDALNANEHTGSFSSKAVESEVQSKTCPLSLFALDEGPRLRLLSATLRQLQKEVSDISVSCEVVSRDGWLTVASEVIKGSIRPVCSGWLQEEVALEIGDIDTKLINRISEKVKGDDTVVQNINRSGKAELYADLLFFLRFGCLRTTCCYDSKFLTQHGVNILEDVVIMLADGIASTYLELISVDSNMSTEINSMGVTLCSLSTRQLQRLRNEVALNQWLLQNFESVAAMYEDRFELSVLCRQKQAETVEGQSEKTSWWEKFTFVKSTTLPMLNYVLISPVTLPVKRTKELIEH